MRKYRRKRPSASITFSQDSWDYVMDYQDENNNLPFSRCVDIIIQAHKSFPKQVEAHQAYSKQLEDKIKELEG